MDVTLTRVQGDLNPDDENNNNNNRGESKVSYHGPENDLYISDGVGTSLVNLADVKLNNINLWQRNQPPSTSTHYDLNNSGRDKFMNPIHFNAAIMDHINK